MDACQQLQSIFNFGTVASSVMNASVLVACFPVNSPYSVKARVEVWN